ncbi:MAG: hypothetical protein FJW37_12100, partial [Acidobacteria bacterium]|nr:hypothetical protein [Acidobacteriota bacterium]
MRIALALALCAAAGLAQSLPGAAPLTGTRDFAMEMVDGINEALLDQTARAAGERSRFWKRDYSSREAYERSVAGNRERLRAIIGAVDKRLPVAALEVEATTATPALVAKGAGYKVYSVRWPVFEGAGGEGLLLEPDAQAVARVVAVPDADWSPEM